MYRSYNNYKKPNYGGNRPIFKPGNRPVYNRWQRPSGINTEGYKINEMINLNEVRVIKDGENLGLMSSSEALQLAKNEELDLVLIAEKANPPIVKIIDFSKFKYQEQQKKQKARANSKQQELKEFRIGVSTSANDTNIRIERARKFLKKRDKVKFTLKFIGRELEYKNLGFDKLKTVEEALADVAKVGEAPKLMGKFISITFEPK